MQPLFKLTASVAAIAILLLSSSLPGTSKANAWCSCGQPSSCICGDAWTGAPLDGEMMPMPEGGQPGTPGLDFSQQFGGGGDFFVTTNTGYIDSAIPFTHLRLRYDAAFDNPTPDRAEFFYAQYGPLSPTAPGLLEIERSVDYQDFTPYFEYAWTNRFSMFFEAPLRSINPVVNPSHTGFSDVIAGFKWAHTACPNWDYLTFQFKVYAPTGNSRLGLGTNHVSLEPGVLFFRRLTDRTVLEGEVRDWIPISDSEFNGRDYAGNVLRYGLGLGYDLMQDCNSCRQPRRLTAVTEFVGWTILNGQGLDGGAFLDAQAIDPSADLGDFVFDASGDTIVNVKMGARYTSGPRSVYAGYGRALTGDVWYQDILRLEYRALY